MIIETNGPTYWRIRDHWLSQLSSHLGRGFEDMTREFRKFITSQGARFDESLLDPNKINVCDSVGSIPGVTRIIFEDRDYTLFALGFSE